MLEISDLSHGYGDRTLWKRIDVRLLPREHVALIGRNGVGKSTLLQILAGRLPHDRGRVAWLPTVQVGYLTQHADLSDYRTPRQALQASFSALYEKEQLLERTAVRLAEAQGDELDRLLAHYARLQEELEEAGIYEVNSRIDSVASGLGLLELGLDRPIEALSGGQRTKVLLAQLLLQSPDVLLLDEPTNFLDAEHVEWLAGFLQNHPSSFVVVSHDIPFVERVADVIWQIENGELIRYSGGYRDFLQYADQRNAQHAQSYARQQEEIKRMEEFVQKNIARASTTKRAQSRRKQLDKMERIAPPASVAPPHIEFPAAPAPSRFTVRTKKLQIGYQYPLLPTLELEIERGSKLAFTGCNGIGKSTLLRTLIGDLAPYSGAVELGDGVRVGYFAQENYRDDEATALDTVWRAFPAMTQQEVRRALARSGLKAEHIMQPVRALSGGEQAKVRLCLLMLRRHNVLALDEPTNHLDQAAKRSLAAALHNFPGTLLLVSHEPEFYRPFVTQVVDVEAIGSAGRDERIVARTRR